MGANLGGAALQIRGLDVWAGSAPLILDVNWQIMPNERWALLGGNGAGKSTLLRAIAAAARRDDYADMEIAVDEGLRLGMLEQTAVSGSTLTVREEVMSRMGDYQTAKAELEAAEAACTTGAECELERLEAATAAFEAFGGYSVDAKVARVLTGLGFKQEEFDQPCNTFSGGWQMRIGLARLLLSDPELLILDEPTNHLDASARQWLGEYVGSYAGTVLVVSHDEGFVSAAADSIAEVVGGRLELYKSVKLSKFKEERAERQARAVATVEAQERERKKMQEFIDRMGAKASKAKQAKDRQGKLAKLAKNMEAAKQLISGERYRPRLKIAEPPSCGELPLALRDATLRHQQATQDILSSATLPISKGMRLIIRGPNGAGKSTLLRSLAGTLPLVSGERLEDDRLALGFFAQDLAQELPQDAKAAEYVAETVRMRQPDVSDERCRSVMGALGLSGDKALREIGTLSGGEKARVALAAFCLTPCNVLLLDEPTNHLDVESIAALLDALEDYEGAIVVISHDRPFCEAVRCTHVAYVSSGKITLEERSLRDSDFTVSDRGVVNVATGSVLSETNQEAVDKVRAENKVTAKLDRAQQKARGSAPRKIKTIEKKVADLEVLINQIDAELLEAGSDASKAAELLARREEAESESERLFAEWDELEALLAV